MKASWIFLLAGALAVSAWYLSPGVSHTSSEQVERGKYLVELAGCSHCHTPGYLRGKTDMSRFLAGSDVGFEVPGLGTFVGPNLTPDKETGLGNWTDAQIIAAVQTGVIPDGRILAPIMPWRSFAELTPSDARAVVAYLRSLPPVHHKVPGPFGPGEKTTVVRMSLIPPDDARSARN